MGYYGWRPYVPVAEKRRQAERKLATLNKQRRSVTPVTIEGRTIAKSFWGTSWCINLERYSDYENRLARGRTYLRAGSVVDLQISKGEIAAMVAGSALYKVKIAIAPVPAARWKAICRDCAGTIDSLIELLQGRLSKGVMDRVCRTGDYVVLSVSDTSGERLVPLPWSKLIYDAAKGRYAADIDERAWKGAPSYDAAETPWTDPRYDRDISDYYCAPWYE